MTSPTPLSPELAPYPAKSYLPFILYPPGMKHVQAGKSWLEEHIDMEQPGVDFVLYIGIPFCRTRFKSCPYFISLLSESDPRGREDAYVDALVKDIQHWSTYRKFGEGTVKNIYIGGGTGSILKTSNLQRIIDAIYTSFRVADEAEFTLEGNARDYTQEKIDFIVNSKINRISLGVQSFQPEILSIVGSPHAADDSDRVIREFQERGFNNIQLDLMYNMPGHTMEIWKRDLQHLNELGVPHFTIYLYRIHDNTVQAKLISKGKVERPADPESPMVKAMYGEAKEIAEAMGYKMYMVDHFAKEGFENKYNYYNWKEYIDTLAIGPASYSYFDGYRLGTESDIDRYIERVNANDFLISSVTDKMDGRVQRERYIIFGFLYYEIEFSFYMKKFGTSIMDDFGDTIARLERKGLLEVSDDRIRLTDLGIAWHTNVILEFFNEKFWEDTDSLTQPNWSLNGVMVEAGAHSREHWLGDPAIDFFPAIEANND